VVGAGWGGLGKADNSQLPTFCKVIPMPGRPLKKLVLLSGTAGVNIDSVLELARETIAKTPPPGLGRVGVEKFEDLLTRRLLAHITSVLGYFIESRPSAIAHFHEALDTLRSRIEESGIDALYLAAHLSYMAEDHLIPNPALPHLIRLAEETTVIYYVEDYYDALERIRRHAAGISGYLASFSLDPLSYLEWRGLDFNLLGLLENMDASVETIIFGIKHPRETHLRLLRYAALPRVEARRAYHLAYFSHPITFYRAVSSRLRLSGKRAPLSGLRGVARLEALKEKLRELIPSLVLFEPTTVDEIVEDPPEAVAEALGCGPCRGGGEPVMSPVISRENRWPLPSAPLHRDYTYLHGAPLNIVGREYEQFYGVETWRGLRQAFCPKHCLPEEAGGCPEMVSSKLRKLIDLQVRLRDYEYVAQSSLLIAATVVYIAPKPEGGWGAWMVRSHGMEAEIRRAQALGKPVYLLVDIIELQDPGAPELSAARDHTIECGLAEASSSEEATQIAPEACLSELVKRGPFAARPSLVNLAVTPLERFARDLAELAGRPS
jgi:hypothetical protein